MKCLACKKDTNRTIEGMCVDCYVDNNIPTKVDDRWWIYVVNLERKPLRESRSNDYDERLSSAIISGDFTVNKNNDSIELHTDKENVSIPLTADNIDNLAKRTGILVGKWLIYRIESEIDSAWKTIAVATINGNLGTSAKVSTLLHKQKRYVICVYTYNYLDFRDVENVRNVLKEIEINEKLCYKPDIYTYLGIYYGTTHLSPCRYRI